MRPMPEMPGLPDWLVRATDESLATYYDFREVQHVVGDDVGRHIWIGRGIELLVNLEEEEIQEPLFAVSWGCRPGSESVEGNLGTHFWDDALPTILRRAA